MKELEEIIDKIQEEYCQRHVFGEFFYNKEYTIKAIKEAYTLGRNKTADWCAKHVETWFDSESGENGIYIVDREAILAAKTCKELDV